MGRATCVCAICSEHFTRRYSATRHNLTIHENRGEIVTYLEYLVRRKTVRYHASDPFMYRRSNKKRIHQFAIQQPTCIRNQDRLYVCLVEAYQYLNSYQYVFRIQNLPCNLVYVLACVVYGLTSIFVLFGPTSTYKAY
jgi:hypothetical protein